LETFWRAADPQANERIVVEHLGDHLIRFGYARASAAVVWGRPLRWETGHTHTVEVQVPSLYRGRDGAYGRIEHAIDFRERSCVAVWFSGGRALGLITEPWPRGIAGGGRAGEGFSGEVRSAGARLV